MKAALERFARRWWGGELGAVGVALSVATAPASWVWAGATRLGAPRATRRVEGLHVVSVGNLAVGGTGKTPLAAWLASTLAAAGVRTSVLVGGQGTDEALLHRAWNPSVPVIAEADRVEGALRARAAGAGVAVLDDGFQHRRLARDLDVVLLSADDPYPGALLPRGPYREPSAALGRADLVVVTRRSAALERARAVEERVNRDRPGLVIAGVHLAPGHWRRLDGASAEAPARDVLAVCAVARPGAFQSAVAERTGGRVELAAFADHHAYTRADAARLARRAAGRPLVATEKDAVKLFPMAGLLGEVYVLADRLAWDFGEAAVRERVLTRVSGMVVA
jgi:tetraacyldisaccharide 4'-kinase